MRVVFTALTLAAACSAAGCVAGATGVVAAGGWALGSGGGEALRGARIDSSLARGGAAVERRRQSGGARSAIEDRRRTAAELPTGSGERDGRCPGAVGTPANAPVGEVEVSDTVRGRSRRRRDRGSAAGVSPARPGLPAVAATGAVTKAGASAHQAEKACQVPVSVAPARTVAHQSGRPRRRPDHRRYARIADRGGEPVEERGGLALKSEVVRPRELLGDQANPMRSVLAPVATARVRSAFTCPETKSSISSSGAAVQPYADDHAQRRVSEGTYVWSSSDRAGATVVRPCVRERLLVAHVLRHHVATLLGEASAAA